MGKADDRVDVLKVLREVMEDEGVQGSSRTAAARAYHAIERLEGLGARVGPPPPQSASDVVERLVRIFEVVELKYVVLAADRVYGGGRLEEGVLGGVDGELRADLEAGFFERTVEEDGDGYFVDTETTVPRHLRERFGAGSPGGGEDVPGGGGSSAG